jgi:hypothetical protein
MAEHGNSSKGSHMKYRSVTTKIIPIKHSPLKPEIRDIRELYILSYTSVPSEKNCPFE